MSLPPDEPSSLFAEQGLAPVAPSPAPAAKSPRSWRRSAGWQSDMARSASYLMGQAKSDAERAQVDRLYDQAIADGPDFLHYRSKSVFEEAAKQGIDRNAYARILNALDLIERGTYRHCRKKGKQGIPRTAARVLRALLGLALRYGRVYPSLLGLAHLANVCKQTVVNCLDVLKLYGFVVIQRRIKRVRTAFGIKVVQDTNAYTIQEPTGLGALAAAVFGRRSESKSLAAYSSKYIPSKQNAQRSRIYVPADDPVAEALAGLREAMKGKEIETV